ncbi:AAA family ATPase [Streptomyces californicus]|uniref:helix-turn-helix transcriptional regulator n=1 Tax=Streptomyces californicus TaxID=67351 RepID=UPI0036D8811D
MIIENVLFRQDFATAIEPHPEVARSRADTHAEFEWLLREDSDRCAVVEISGGRWSGKTALLADVARTAGSLGWQVAVGSATSPLPGVPFGAFVDALNPLIDQHRDDLVAGCPSAHARWLGGVFPALATALPSARPTDPAELYHVFHAIRGLVGALSAFGDLLLVLDDAHWADEASVQLISHLLRHPPDGQVMLVLAHRARQADRTLSGLLDAAVASGAARRVEIAPLTEQEALALLPSDFSSSRCAGLLHESGGNPGLLRVFASLGIEPQSSGEPISLPADVLTECLRDFHALSEREWLVARSAAVLDDPFDPELLKLVAELNGVEVLNAIDELIAQDLIRPEGSSRRLRFANPLLRAAAYQSAGPGWLFGAHARATRVLLARGGRAHHVARHVQHTAAADDKHSVRLLLDAGEQCLWDRPAQSASWLRTVTELEVDRLGIAFDRKLKLGRALALASQLLEAREVLGDLALTEPQDPSIWIEALCWRAWVCCLIGEAEHANSDLTAASRMLAPDAVHDSVRVHQARLALALDTNARPDEADVSVLRQHVSDMSAATAAASLAVLSVAALRLGDREHARRHAAAAAELYEALDEQDVARELDGLYRLGAAEAGLGWPEVAATRYEWGLQVAERRRLGGLVPQFATALAATQLRLGDLDGAARHAACGRSAAAATGSDALLAKAVALEAAIAGSDADLAVDDLDAGQAPTGAASALVSLGDDASARLEGLSRRELEVAVLVSVGRTNQQIARRLELSHKTVETYLGRIFKKLFVCSRAEVAALVGLSGRVVELQPKIVPS